MYGNRPRATTAATRVEKGSVAPSGHHRDPPGDRAPDERGDRIGTEPDRPSSAPTTPVSTRSIVDLPAPLGPTRTSRSAGAISRSMSWSTRRPR